MTDERILYYRKERSLLSETSEQTLDRMMRFQNIFVYRTKADRNGHFKRNECSNLLNPTNPDTEKTKNATLPYAQRREVVGFGDLCPPLSWMIRGGNVPSAVAP